MRQSSREQSERSYRGSTRDNVERLQRAQLGERSTSDPSYIARQQRITALSKSSETVWEIDTNAGPILTRSGTATEIKRYMERMIPLLRRTGYSSSWRRSKNWHVIDVSNSRGRVVHSAAFIDKSKRPNPVHDWGVLGTVEHTDDCECRTRVDDLLGGRQSVNGFPIVERVGSIAVVEGPDTFVVFRGGPMGERKTIDGARRLAERKSAQYDSKI